MAITLPSVPAAVNQGGMEWLEAAFRPGQGATAAHGEGFPVLAKPFTPAALAGALAALLPVANSWNSATILWVKSVTSYDCGRIYPLDHPSVH